MERRAPPKSWSPPHDWVPPCDWAPSCNNSRAATSLIQCGEFTVVKKVLSFDVNPVVGLAIDYDELKQQFPDFLNRVARISEVMGRLGIGPKIYRKASRADVVILYMEYLPGGHITEEMHIADPAKLKNLFERFHNLGYIHGDLHPGNLMLDCENNARLIDFETTVNLREVYSRSIGWFTPGDLAEESTITRLGEVFECYLALGGMTLKNAQDHESMMLNIESLI